MQNVLIAPNIPARYPNYMIDLQSVSHLADLPIHQIDKGMAVSILIGIDHAYALMPREVRCNPCDKHQPYAMRTLFGWSLNGHIGGRSVIQVTSNFVSIDQKMVNTLKMKPCDDDRVSTSLYNRKVIDLWSREVWHTERHYIVTIPQNKGKQNVPDSKFTSISIFKNLRNRLPDKHIMESYSNYCCQIRSGEDGAGLCFQSNQWWQLEQSVLCRSGL